MVVMGPPLLLAAGDAPRYGETPLDEPAVELLFPADRAAAAHLRSVAPG